MDLFAYDRAVGAEILCGIDEAGRGPLAGPVCAAAVILPPDAQIEGLNDSKKLSEKKRALLYDEITAKAAAWSVAFASVEEIDAYNILQATFLAMRRAAEGLAITPTLCLVDGNRNPGLGIHSRLVVKGDATSASIAAASILAKVTRDRVMLELAAQYPQYAFEQHKGYGTKLHYERIAQYGVSEIHRKSFLKKILEPQAVSSRGNEGERAVACYLEERGWEIVARNYHSRYGEIDLIAKRDQILAFVEVKARGPKMLGSPAEAVTAAKQKKLTQTALLYLQEHGMALQPRFDVAEVYFPSLQVRYLENAFPARV